MWEINPLVVGVDVGGTKIAAAVVDTEGHITGLVQRPTDTSHPDRTLQSITATVRDAIAAAGYRLDEIRAVGLGIPGKVDPVQGLGVLSVNLGWRDVPVTARLQAELGLPCSIENDVSVGALGESRYGVGRGAASLVYLVVGTGIAARAVLGGQLYRGRAGMAGEIGHVPFVPNGLLCKCGTRGCLEAIASGPGLAARAQAALQAGQASSLRDVALAGPLTSPQVFAAADQGDSLALTIIDETGGYLAQAVQLLIVLYDPVLVVVGGGLAANARLMAAMYHHLETLTEQALFHEMYSPDRVKISVLGTTGPILGAAALVI